MSNNKFYIIVEIVGISLAIAFSIPFLSLLADKWDIDHGRDYKHIYAVCPEGTFETTLGLGKVLKETIPEIERYAQRYFPMGYEGICRLFMRNLAIDV